MIVLLIGGSSRFMDSVIDKMNKSGHQVYLLTGQKNKRSSYKRVFEKYNFEYDTDSIEDIFKSIQPELIIFMGAYDTNFDWSMARQESVRYSTALTNFLSAYSMTGKGRFVYIVPRGLQQRPRGECKGRNPHRAKGAKGFGNRSRRGTLQQLSAYPGDGYTDSSV